MDGTGIADMGSTANANRTGECRQWHPGVSPQARGSWSPALLLTDRGLPGHRDRSPALGDNGLEVIDGGGRVPPSAVHWATAVEVLGW
jgi:hypothetical protein